MPDTVPTRVSGPRWPIGERGAVGQRGDPAHRTRQAGPVQAAVLMVTSCLTVLGAVLIAPVQPRIAEAFAGQAGAAVLTPLVLTTPALFIALLAPFAGRLI